MRIRLTICQDNEPFSDADRTQLAQVIAEAVGAHDRDASVRGEAQVPGQLASLDPTVVDLIINLAEAGVITAVVHGVFQCIARWQASRAAPIKVRIDGAEAELPANASEDRLRAIVSALTEPRKPLPDQIRDVVARLTGTTCRGVVAQDQQDGRESYRLSDGEASFVCTRAEGHWTVIESAGGGPSQIWTEVPDGSVDNALSMITALIEPKLGPLNARFEKMLWIMESQIQRKWFWTKRGRIVFHSRPHSVGSEIVCEVEDEGLCLHFIWEKSLGGIDSQKIRRIATPSF